MTITKSVSINILQIFYQDGGEEDDREMDAPEIKIKFKLDLTQNFVICNFQTDEFCKNIPDNIYEK